MAGRPRLRPTRAVIFSMISATAIPGAASAQQPAPAGKGHEAHVAWRYAPAGSRFEDLVTDGRVVFVLDREGAIHALDAAGNVKWISKEPLNCDYGFGIALSPAADFDALLVGGGKGLV